MWQTKHVAAIIGVIVIAIMFDVHLYLFDREKYLHNKAVQLCTRAEMAKFDYHECKTEGYRDERCDGWLATAIEASAQCKAADSAVNAEYIRHRARTETSK